jgi:hypothetical protein
MNLTATVETVTPQRAAEWLVKNTHNRPEKPGAIRRYVLDMVAGQWDLNGESIKFNGDGRLLDGQNRLRACIEAGTSFRTVVVRGATGQETIDMGVPRRLADILKLQGEVSVIDLAAAVTRLWNFERDPLDTSRGFSPTIHVALSFLADHPGLRESIGPASVVRKAVGLRGSVGAAMHYITTSLDAEDAEMFWAKLSSGADLGIEDPIFHLRNTLLADRLGSRRNPRMTTVREWALTAKTWNAFREGARVKLLVWRTGGAHPESYPVPE